MDAARHHPADCAHRWSAWQRDWTTKYHARRDCLDCGVRMVSKYYACDLTGQHARQSDGLCVDCNEPAPPGWYRAFCAGCVSDRSKPCPKNPPCLAPTLVAFSSGAPNT